jgi:NADP-reducing hydrogenase subunit HndB
MNKLKSPDDLMTLKMNLQKMSGQQKTDKAHERPVRIKVAMATCSIASGSREILHYLTDELDKRNIHAEIRQTGCMGYCYAEPTVEVQLPGEDPVVFGFVDIRKADDIIENYIKSGSAPEGIIPVNYEKVTLFNL